MPFIYSHYVMLKRNNPEKAEEYISSFQTKEKAHSNQKRKENIAFLKENGVKVYPNYKDETIQKLVDEVMNKEEIEELETVEEGVQNAF